MPKLNLQGTSSQLACSKPHCRSDGGLMNRHHVRHQAMWIGIWCGRRRDEDKWKAFVARYKAFLPEDWVRLCIRHHAEVHLMYDSIIEMDKERVGKPLIDYTWKQAEQLMNKLEAACSEWLKIQTPGMDAAQFALARKRRQSKKKS